MASLNLPSYSEYADLNISGPVRGTWNDIIETIRKHKKYTRVELHLISKYTIQIKFYQEAKPEKLECIREQTLSMNAAESVRYLQRLALDGYVQNVEWVDSDLTYMECW